MKKIQNSPLFILTLLYQVLLTGCNFMVQLQEQETLQINLPEWPPADTFTDQYPELIEWKITFASSTEIREYYTCEKSVFVTFNKNLPASLIVQPVTKLTSGNPSNYFMPAGLIYPYADVDAGLTNATWNQGFLAVTMNKIILSKKETGVSDNRLETFLSSFNWKKAQNSIENKINAAEENKAFYNPWLIDSSKLLENLCYGTFKATLLNLSGGFEVDLSDINKESELCLLSAFVTENQFLNTTKKIYIKKDQEFFIGDGKNFGLIIKGKSAKNLSRDIVYMPIYCEGI